MRNLAPALVGIIIFLGIVSGTLWSRLNAERQLTADLETRIAQRETALPGPAAPLRQPPSAIEANPAPVPNIQPPEPRLAPEERIQVSGAYLQSDMTARARVQAWTARLSMEGKSLTPAQTEALNATAVAELRRETDETAALALHPHPTDAVSVAQARSDFVDRQNETNRRILEAITPKLTAQQLDGLRTQFDAWYAGAKASARVELERAAANVAF